RGIPADLVGELRGDLLLDAAYIRVGLLRRHAGPELADRAQVVRAALVRTQVALVEPQRDPQLAVVGKVVAARHHADDFIRLAFERDLAGHGAAIAAEEPLPEAVAEQRHLAAAGPHVLVGE